jgi:hypothetical protein
MGVSSLEFDLSQEDLDSLSITSVPPEQPEDELSIKMPVSRYFNHSHRYRLRLCESRKLDDQTTFDAAEWTIRRTHWPPHIFITVNDEIILPRLKQHYHEDLPVELTNFLVEGKNIIDIALPSYPQNIKQDVAYFIAVEIIVTLDHESVCALVSSSPHISTDETKSDIKRRLQLDTDDIIIESDALTITVADSFSSKLFDIPVRGRNCRHLECIDLENWLNSRPCKISQEAGEPTMVNTWHCPICGQDARPDNLQVDDFFVEIKNKLLEEGKGNTKRIEIVADGTWKAVKVTNENATSDKDGVQQNPSSQEAVQVLATVTKTTGTKRKRRKTSESVKTSDD